LAGRAAGRADVDGNRMPAPIVLGLVICTVPIELAFVWPRACFPRASLRPSSVCSLSRKRVFHVWANRTASNEINACDTEKIIGRMPIQKRRHFCRKATFLEPSLNAVHLELDVNSRPALFRGISSDRHDVAALNARKDHVGRIASACISRYFSSSSKARISARSLALTVPPFNAANTRALPDPANALWIKSFSKEVWMESCCSAGE
jgi:hypothetical protein